MSHLVVCAGGVACCRYQQRLSSQLIGQGYCAEGQALRWALTADYDSPCWTVRGLIMVSVGLYRSKILQYNVQAVMFRNSQIQIEIIITQSRRIITSYHSSSPQYRLATVCSNISGVGREGGGWDCRTTVMMLHQLAGLHMRVSGPPPATKAPRWQITHWTSDVIHCFTALLKFWFMWFIHI